MEELCSDQGLRAMCWRMAGDDETRAWRILQDWYGAPTFPLFGGNLDPVAGRGRY